MPELPEVEVAARHLRRWALGRCVVAVEAEATRVLRPGKPAALKVLVGARLANVSRVGKNLLLRFEGAKGAVGVWAHLGMTGKWLRRDEGDEVPRNARVRLRLDDGSWLHYVDARMFGRVQVVPKADFSSLKALAGLGPDPLAAGIDAGALHGRLARTKRPVKVALMDQALVPGVGNIQASEALYRARVDPRRAASTITPAEAKRIAAGVLASVAHTIEAMEAEDDVVYVEEGGANPFLVYDRAGERCRRRGGTVERVVQAGRSTYFCAHCQR